MQKLASVVVVCLAIAGGSSWAQEPEVAAQAAAEAWLELVDNEQYEESWVQAAELFKGAVTTEQWRQAASGARKPFGALVSRKMKSRMYTKQLPGAPDGQYVVILFDAVFENKASAMETVTPMLDPDGTWRVSGYYIR